MSGPISCPDCYGHCARCGKPICLEHSVVVGAPDEEGPRLCKRCDAVLSRRRRLALFGRTVLVWLIDAGGFATIIAYVFVPLAFLALRRKEPDMPRPFKVTHPNLVGIGGFVLALALIAAYLPGSPSALIWPYEWATISVWTILGVLLFLRYRLKHPG